MSVEMKQKAGANVTPKDDAILYDFLIADSGVVEGCVASAIGGTQMKITSAEALSLAACLSLRRKQYRRRCPPRPKHKTVACS